MLTEVILEGALGKQFGREWNLAVRSPGEALRIIDANKPGVMRWIRGNLSSYGQYGVLVDYEDGRSEQLNADNFILQRKMKRITFVPLTAGAGGNIRWGQVLEGAALLVAAYFTAGATVGGAYAAFGSAAASAMAGIGATLLLQGFISGLTTQPSTKNSNSFYFDGPTNTATQGQPVPLIYGRMLVGSQPVSVSLNVNQMM